MGDSLSKITWDGILYNRCGINLHLCEDGYNNWQNNELIKSMPAYPNQGSLKKQGNTVIIKIS